MMFRLANLMVIVEITHVFIGVDNFTHGGRPIFTGDWVQKQCKVIPIFHSHHATTLHAAQRSLRY
jgi:hypothetical protein